jgi:aminopeptidase N
MVYQKGAAILLMLEGWIGEDRVQTALRTYLKKHEFANATTFDLESLLAGAGDVMDAFLNRTGVPSIRGDCMDGAISIEARAPMPLPVCVRGDGLAQTCSVVDPAHHSIPVGACPSWIYFNSGATGYYRTEWSETQFKALDLKLLTPAERLMLVYDLRAEKSELFQKLADDPEPEIRRAVAGEVSPNRKQ